MPTKEINDGVERAGEYSELVISLLDTPEVQRTKKIINNGFCSEAFPSISHSRKLHLIGTAKKAKQVYDALQKNDSNIPSSFLPVMEALGILHDTGHPPFAHALRNIIEDMTGKTHEQVSAEIVLGKLSFHDYFSERPHLLGDERYVKHTLEKYRKIKKVPEILHDFGVDPQLVAEVLHPGITSTPLQSSNDFLKKLIDGNLIDIDKMDYIPRDAAHANIEEARVNPGRILNGLKVVRTPEGGRDLAVVDTSLDDLCMWISARKYLYQNIYTHKTVLKYEAMMTEAVKRSMSYFKEKDIEIHLLTDDRLFNILTYSDEISAQLVMDVQFGRTRKYSEAFAIRSRKVMEGNEYHQTLMGIIDFLNSQETRFPEDKIRDEIIRNAGKDIQDHEVLVYFPYKHRTREQWKEKLDLFVYSHRNPEKIDHLKNMVGENPVILDSKADDILYELCKPQSSLYFAIYTRPEHAEDVSRAAKEFADNVKRK